MNEVEKNKKEEFFLNEYGKNYKNDLINSIKEINKDDLVTITELNNKKNKENIFNKILKFLCLKK